MHIIQTIADIRRLQDDQAISSGLAHHLERKVKQLHGVLEPEAALADFTLHEHGPFGILEAGDHSLTAIGLPESLAEIMPEWVSRLHVENEIYYVLYIVTSNECVIQIYLPDAIMAETIRGWLLEQPLEEEKEGDEHDSLLHLPF